MDNSFYSFSYSKGIKLANMAFKYLKNNTKDNEKILEKCNSLGKPYYIDENGTFILWCCPIMSIKAGHRIFIFKQYA